MIGVWHDEDAGKTFYVRRSATQPKCPGRWCLLFARFDPTTIGDPTEQEQAAPLFWRMSRTQLGGVPIAVSQYLRTDTCFTAPATRMLRLHLYRVRLIVPPRLNPAYYSAGEWLTPEEYVTRMQGMTCCLCTQQWADYCEQHGLAHARIAPAVGDAG